MLLLLTLVLTLCWAGPPGPIQQSQGLAPIPDPTLLPRAETGRWASWDRANAASKPSEIPNALRIAFDLGRQGRHREALSDLYVLLQQAPDEPAALYQLGVTYYRVKSYTFAARALERFVEIAPGEVRMTRALGHCYYQLGEFEKAKGHYARCLQAGEDSAEIALWCALSLMRTEDPEGAKAMFARSRERNPRSAECEFWNARLLYDIEESQDALVLARKAAELDPFSTRTWFLISNICRELDLLDQAADAEARFRKLDPLDQSLHSLDVRLIHQPLAINLHAGRARLKAAMGDPQGARAAALLLFQRRTDLAGSLAAFGVMREIRDTQGAYRIAQQLASRFPGERDAWLALEAFFKRMADSANLGRAQATLARLAEEGD